MKFSDSRYSLLILLLLLGVYLFPFPLGSSNKQTIIQNYHQYKKHAQQKTLILFIDYTKPHFIKRLYVYDLVDDKVVFQSHVAHAKKSGNFIPKTFSNVPESKYSSKGVFVTAERFESQYGKGKYKIGMRIKGLEKGINDNVHYRNIVFHPSTNFWSNGCFSSRPKANKKIIDLTKDGTLMVVKGKE